MADSRTPNDLLEQVRALHDVLREDMNSRWRRDLPFEELISDRWERAQRLGFGDGASIYETAYVFGDVRVGEQTWIGPLVMLDGSAGLSIGHHCSISTGVQIYTHDTVRWALSGGDVEPERAPVLIGDCTYIGPQTVVVKGVQVGDHCVIGANSLVNSSIPPRSVAWGSPARIRGRVVTDESGSIELAIAPDEADHL